MNKPQSIIVIFSILLSGCFSDNTPQIINEFPPTSNGQDNTQEPISTITVKPSKEPTWTPVPTLSADIKKQNLFQLFMTNGGCDFPCWWGVGLGDPLQKAAELAPLIGEQLRSDKLFSTYGYAISLGEFNEIRGLHIGYFVDDHQKVESMIVDLIYPSLYRDYSETFKQSLSVESILKKYGMPSEILFLVGPRVEKDSPIAYALFVEYENLDFGVEYFGIVDSENPIKICSIKLDDHHLWEVHLYFHNLSSILKERSRFFINEFKPIEQVTNFSKEDFYRLFSTSDNTQCIETSYDIWK